MGFRIMSTLLRRLSPAFGALLVLLVAGSAGAAPGSGASARAFAIKVIAPGQSEVATASVIAPPDAVAFGGSFAFPADGSIVASGPVTASSSASSGATATATASSEVSGLTLFGGEIAVAALKVRAVANAKSGQDGTGNLSRSSISGLVVLGQAIDAAPGGRVQLGDWGYATLLVQAAAPASDGFRGIVTALDVRLTAEHGGLPAGSEILVGYAEAAAQAAPPPPETTATQPRPPPPSPVQTVPAQTPGAQKAPAAKRESGRVLVPPIVRKPLPSLTPKLTKRGYVFPVHGPVSFTDTFGAARAVVSWHHGQDLFAPIGAPVLAVARGTVFSVGWNDIGGNRLWLRDSEGNEFYYAHLSAFSPLAINGAHVEPGDVLGFVGNTGDAETTPPHLHFEIHPVGLLGLGYDGVINPHSYLLAWRRLQDVRFVAGAGWVPSLAQISSAPTPGAFLLSATDISVASGLDPDALEQALAEPVSAEATDSSTRKRKATRPATDTESPDAR